MRRTPTAAHGAETGRPGSLRAEAPRRPAAPSEERIVSRSNGLIRLGATLGAVAVAAGAFGAHALGGRLDPDALETYDVAARYHLLHALAITLVGVAEARGIRNVRGAGWAFATGIALFSGSLYALALSGVEWLGAITPLGGVGFIVGWLWLAWRHVVPSTSAPGSEHHSGDASIRKRVVR